ncbi:uncharacterized protein LOC102672797 isoform X2 [Apis dorsata]|uniref:uncharacterized protein LOC102672797 isoform X2 n=1 Tax=Apis dorsata TaxID=7462 RepID=UPI0003DF5DA1|nr:uncharacterized protein LOC102672797 isoform X2 [Apis dorsata]
MGNYVNKFFTHKTETYNNEIEKEEIKDSSAIDEVTIEKNMQTPPIIRKTLVTDPRSVTSGISRTPIEVNNTPVGLNKKIISAIPKHLQNKSYLETDIDKIMLCLTPKKHLMPKLIEIPKQNKNEENLLTPISNNLNNKKIITDIEKERYNILGLDPRSPAADFDRTPILMPKSIERLRARSQECLHRQGSYDTDIFYPKFSYCEMSSQFNVTEVQVLADLDTSAVNSLHSVITDSDDKLNEPESSYSNDSVKTNFISEIEKELEDQSEVQSILEQNNCNDNNIKKNAEQKCIINNDIIKIWRDSLILDTFEESELNESDNVQEVTEKMSQINKEEVIITFDNDNTKDLIPKLINSENEKTKVDTIKKKKKIVKSEIKVTTDEKKSFIDKNENESIKIRTPLGNRSNNEQIQTLLTKSPQQVFKNRNVVSKILKENTSPHKKYFVKSKLNGVQWDPDSTVII